MIQIKTGNQVDAISIVYTVRRNSSTVRSVPGYSTGMPGDGWRNESNIFDTRCLITVCRNYDTISDISLWLLVHLLTENVQRLDYTTAVGRVHGLGRDIHCRRYCCIVGCRIRERCSLFPFLFSWQRSGTCCMYCTRYTNCQEVNASLAVQRAAPFVFSRAALVFCVYRVLKVMPKK